MAKLDDEERTREAKRILERVERDSETIGASSLARTASRIRDHMTGSDAPQDDAAEVWGRRIGRSLGLIAVVILVVYLFKTYVMA